MTSLDADERRAAMAASPKPCGYWIDLAYNSEKHNIACPSNLLGGKYTDAERKAAKKKLDSDGGDPRAALEWARDHLAKKALKAKARVTLGRTDPTKRKRAMDARAPMSAKQEYMLRGRFGLKKIPDALTAGEAQKIIGYEFVCEKQGLCNYDQRDFLAKYVGVSGRGMSVANGRRLVDAWRANDKRRLSPTQIQLALARPEPGWDG